MKAYKSAAIRGGKMVRQATNLNQIAFWKTSDFSNMVALDSGTIKSIDFIENFYKTQLTSSIENNTDIALFVESALKTRDETTKCKRITKCYDLSIQLNHAVQTTNTIQPQLAGDWSVLDRYAISNSFSDDNYLSFNNISKNVSDKWSISIFNKIDGKQTDSSWTGSTISSIGTTYNNNKLVIKIKNESGISAVGTIDISRVTSKNTLFTFIANGNSTIDFYVDNEYIETLIIGSNFVFNKLMSGGGTYLNGICYGIIVNSIVLTEFQRTKICNYFQTSFGELPNVSIGVQNWALQNARIVVTAMGNYINNVPDNATFITSKTIYDSVYSSTSGSIEEKTYAALKSAAMWRYAYNVDTNQAIFGILYNHFALVLIQMDIDYFNAINPNYFINYRVPLYSTDFVNLFDYLGGTSVAGGKLKSPGIVLFSDPNIGATNESGFSAVGGGDINGETGADFLFRNYGVFGCQEIAGTNGQFMPAVTSSNASVSLLNSSRNWGVSLRMIKQSPKLVTLGDSVTFQSKWQPTIVKQKGYYYIEKETEIGVYHVAMGVGSSKIIPLINDSFVGQHVGNSIYERADSVKYYNPDIVFVLGGYNDLAELSIGLLGNSTDEAYVGDAVYSNAPSFYSAYKGVLKKLTEQNPNARIICLTIAYCHLLTPLQLGEMADAIINCASQYNCESIDLLRNVLINSSNYTTYLSDDVHPNTAGGLLIGNYIASQL